MISTSNFSHCDSRYGKLPSSKDEKFTNVEQKFVLCLIVSQDEIKEVSLPVVTDEMALRQRSRNWFPKVRGTRGWGPEAGQSTVATVPVYLAGQTLLFDTAGS